MNDKTITEVPLYRIKSVRFKKFALDIGDDDSLIISSKRRHTQLFSISQDRIINKESGKVLSAKQDDVGRVEIFQIISNDRDNEKWIIEENNRDGCILFNMKYPTMCMTIEEADYGDYCSLVLQPFDGSQNQKFTFYCIKNSE